MPGQRQQSVGRATDQVTGQSPTFLLLPRVSDVGWVYTLTGVVFSAEETGGTAPFASSISDNPHFAISGGDPQQLFNGAQFSGVRGDPSMIAALIGSEPMYIPLKWDSAGPIMWRTANESGTSSHMGVTLFYEWKRVSLKEWARFVAVEPPLFGTFTI